MNDKPKNDGGPAYPVEHTVYDHDLSRNWKEVERGMSIRDHFASDLIPEVYRQYAETANAQKKWDPDWRIHIARDAYHMADAMLKAREL
jgi:hypothetical protein